MNCHELGAVVGELARGHLMDAAQRENALAHAASCACCASRLADERALTDGLRFVASAANEVAPARVEAALLAAFRQQRARTVKPRAYGANRTADYICSFDVAHLMEFTKHNNFSIVRGQCKDRVAQ